MYGTDTVVTLRLKRKICGNDEIVSIEIYHYTYVGSTYYYYHTFLSCPYIIIIITVSYKNKTIIVNGVYL